MEKDAALLEEIDMALQEDQQFLKEQIMAILGKHREHLRQFHITGNSANTELLEPY